MIGIFSGAMATKVPDGDEMVKIATFCLGASVFLGIVDLRGTYA